MNELKIERTMESKGKILGMDVTLVATFESWGRPQGGMFSKGNGIMMTAKGEKVILHGSRIRIPGEGPAMSLRGIRYALDFGLLNEQAQQCGSCLRDRSNA